MQGSNAGADVDSRHVDTAAGGPGVRQMCRAALTEHTACANRWPAGHVCIARGAPLSAVRRPTEGVGEQQAGGLTRGALCVHRYS